VRVYGPDGEPFEKPVASPEDPGPFCFPPVAAGITAAARLMLALLEQEVIQAGGSYAFCDTDSLAIVATQRGRRVDVGEHQSVTALSWTMVRRILDRFEGLNPYDRGLIPGSPWGVKFDSLTTELWCYAISAKRYALYHLHQESPQLVGVRDQPDEDANSDEDPDDYVDWSEHGLGLYLDPTSVDPDASARDARGRRLWVRTAWEWILNDAHSRSARLPKWAERFAVTRFTVSGPRTAEWFDGYNQTRSRDEHIRPGSFGLIAHPAAGFTGRPAAPYERDPHHWPGLRWYDRASGDQITVTSASTLRGEAAELLATGTIPVQTIGEVIRRYRLRPEHKSLAPNDAPASRETTGLLCRRAVESTLSLQTLTGKEGNRLLERLSGEIVEADQYRADYGTRAGQWTAVVTVARYVGAGPVARRAGLDTRTVERAIRPERPTMPHPRNRPRLAQAAAALAAERLRGANHPVPTGTFPTIVRLTELISRGELPRLCQCGCGRELPRGRLKWFSEPCRSRARRTG
jgi:hypothetical protein